jgi:hypothetical protein
LISNSPRGEFGSPILFASRAVRVSHRAALTAIVAGPNRDRLTAAGGLVPGCHPSKLTSIGIDRVVASNSSRGE